MTDFPSPIHQAVSEQDASSLCDSLSKGEFVLLSTTKSAEDEDSNVGAITAEMGDMEVLVVFSSEQAAGKFVQESEDLFDDDEEVDGIVVEGKALLEYLPDGFGMLLDPESERALVIEPGMFHTDEDGRE